MTKFSHHHPYLFGLLKRTITIVVTWNVVTACIVATLLFVGFIGLIVTGISANQSDPSYIVKPIYGSGTNELLSIKVGGIIMGSSEGGSSLMDAFASHQTYGYDVKDQLHAAADQDYTAGVILEIDSPGGTIYGARAIADGVYYYKEKTKKPVYAHIQGQGDSGAYWAASSTDKIFADYGSDIGSIGVIMGPFEYYNKPLAQDGGLLGGGGVVTQNGIESINITAGTSKDVGNPYRKLTDAEIQTLQKSVNNEYDEFVKYVSERRHINASDIRNKIGAMAYDPKTALELKLIDTIGSRDVAYAALAKEANVKDDFYVAREEAAPTGLESLLGVFGQKPQVQATSREHLCSLSKSALAYHGDVSGWCTSK